MASSFAAWDPMCTRFPRQWAWAAEPGGASATEPSPSLPSTESYRTLLLPGNGRTPCELLCGAVSSRERPFRGLTETVFLGREATLTIVGPSGLEGRHWRWPRALVAQPQDCGGPRGFTPPPHAASGQGVGTPLVLLGHTQNSQLQALEGLSRASLSNDTRGQ